MKLPPSPLAVVLVALTASVIPLSGQIAPTIDIEPEDLTILEGESTVFSVMANGSDPLSYQWRKGAANVPNGTDWFYYKEISSANDSGPYTCKVTNPWGSVTSIVATLTVLVPPSITTHPVGKTINIGSNVTFTVKANGTPPLEYQWFQDGTPLDGATSTNLTLLNVQPEDSGEYTVVVHNLAGDYGADDAISNPATLTVLVPPSIVTQPEDDEITAGQSTVFSIVANGSEPLSYQWKFNGSTLVDQTDSLVEVIEATADDAGDYCCVVSNPSGTIVSSNAHLTVNLPPSFTLQPLGRTVYPGSNMIFRCSASGAAPIAYQWYYNYSPIEGATNTEFSFFVSNTAPRGVYSVLASNLVDDTWSDDAILIVKAETVKPTVSITFPTENQRWSNSVITIRGNAADNAMVDFVEYSDHFEPAGMGYQLATRSNGVSWTNWEATYVPYPGTNHARAVSTDDSDNRSVTADRFFFYVVPLPFTLLTNGPGTASSNLGPILEIGKDYTLTAQPGPGAVFTNWTGGYTSTNPTLRFMMKTNLTLTMNFRDIQLPVVTVTNPLPSGSLANATAIVSGTATDNWQIASVRYQLNSNAWAVAAGTSNWTATVTLVNGTNTFKVYSLDLGGNPSLTNTSTTTVTLALAQPNITSIVRNGTTVSVSFASAVGLNYNLEFKDALTDASWTAILPPSAGTGGIMILSDTDAVPTSRYYRIRGQ